MLSNKALFNIFQVKLIISMYNKFIQNCVKKMMNTYSNDYSYVKVTGCLSGLSQNLTNCWNFPLK